MAFAMPVTFVAWVWPSSLLVDNLYGGGRQSPAVTPSPQPEVLHAGELTGQPNAMAPESPESQVSAESQEGDDEVGPDDDADEANRDDDVGDTGNAAMTSEATARQESAATQGHTADCAKFGMFT